MRPRRCVMRPRRCVMHPRRCAMRSCAITPPILLRVRVTTPPILLRVRETTPPILLRVRVTTRPLPRPRVGAIAPPTSLGSRGRRCARPRSRAWARAFGVRFDSRFADRVRACGRCSSRSAR
jgi:hypothetical protein